MAELPNRHPLVAKQFNNGKFVVHKTRWIFSGIPIDQAHERNNAIVKGDGGAVGLTDNPSNPRICVGQVHIDNTLKSTARAKCGKGTHRCVISGTLNWRDLLCIDSNKTELFQFLSHALIDSFDLKTASHY